MSNEPSTQDDQAGECAMCGHLRKFHTASSASVTQERPCSNPEDGEPCACTGYQAVA